MKKNIKYMLLSAALGVLSFLPAKAGVTVDSLWVTNTVIPGVTIVSAPTNSIGTNGLYTLTGRYLSTKDFDNFGITISGLTTATNTGNLTIVLTRANPIGSFGNGTAVATDFENVPLFTLSAPIVVGTNVPLVWTTNSLSADWVRASAYIGVYSITNTCTAGNVVSNFTSVSNLVIRATRKLNGVNAY